MPHLFEPFTLRGVTLRNRTAMSPMCQYSSRDGFANEWHQVHLGSRAVGGVGLCIAEATAVEARGRISPEDLGIWSDSHVEALQPLTRIIHANGAAAGIQIAHAGRKACVRRPWEGGGALPEDHEHYWRVVGPDDQPFQAGYQAPHELSLEEISGVQSSFQSAAKRALEADFNWLEIHAAHGYLIHSFYSPVSNHRKDLYGGNFENRIRFLIETVQTVRKVWPERLPLAVRLSCTDWVDDGWTIAESIELASKLKLEGVDLIDCSSGGSLPKAPVPLGPGYQVPLAEAVRHGAQIAVGAVGMITSPVHADEIIRNGRADIVLLGRELLRDPYWPIHAAQALHQPLPIPDQYLRAF